MNSDKNGYTLLELSIVLLVLGIILAGLIGVFNFSVRSNSQKLTEERMDVIESALLSFMIANGRLPCPAVFGLDQTQPLYGYEVGSQGAFYACDIDLLINSVEFSRASVPIFLGMVPVNTLGLNPEYAFDGYGNRFSYTVSLISVNSSIITQDNLFVPSTNTSCIPSNTGASESTRYCLAFERTRPDINDMSIFDTIGVNLVNGNPEYILTSHGSNGSGAFPRGADQTISGGLLVNGSVPRNIEIFNGVDERDNVECDSGSCIQLQLNFQFVQGIRDRDFDDILRFDTKNNMIAKCNDFSMNICTDQVNGHGMRIDN